MTAGLQRSLTAAASDSGGVALVTGGGGFLGSHLVALLLGRGQRVVVVDTFVTGVRENLPTQNSRLRVVEGDAAEAPSGDYQDVYHLASPASPDAYSKRSIETLRTNARGTERALEIATEAGARFLLASTSEVYGDPLVHPQPETYWGNVNSIGPRSQYDEGKRYAEALTAGFVRERDLDARIVRIFNSYGPRMRVDDGRMPSTFIAAALRGEPIPVHAPGTQTRSLCYVRDTVEGIALAMMRGRTGEVYNVGRADELTVLQFAERVKEIAGSASPIVLIDGRDEDIHRRQPDTRKAVRELGWRARTTLHQGLRETIAWYRDLMPRGNA